MSSLYEFAADGSRIVGELFTATLRVEPWFFLRATLQSGLPEPGLLTLLLSEPSGWVERRRVLTLAEIDVLAHQVTERQPLQSVESRLSYQGRPLAVTVRIRNDVGPGIVTQRSTDRLADGAPGHPPVRDIFVQLVTFLQQDCASDALQEIKDLMSSGHP